MRVFTDLQNLPPLQNTVVTIGSFDGVHSGHKRILERVNTLAMACGGESLVITFEPHPRTVLSPHDPDFKLITTTAEKITLLENAGVQNAVIVPFNREFSAMSAQAYVEDFLVKLFRPRYVVIGYDHRFGANRSGNIDFLRQYTAFEVVEISAQEIDDIAVSSTKIRRALEAADITLANRLLGYRFFFTGIVVKGNQIGRTIGFPTANIAIADPYKLVLPPGIYAAYAQIRGLQHRAMLYIGDRPTVDGLERRIEVNILDFEGDLYGETLSVAAVEYIRSDKKLDSLEALQAQIAADQRAIEAVLEQEDTAPSVAVVILNYNTRAHLATYLPSVLEHTKGARIVVADNGSPDDSVDFLRQNFPGVEVIVLDKNHGFAQGYNEALKQVEADIYVLLNSDVAVTQGWLLPIISAFKADSTLAAAQPKILSWTQQRYFEHAGAAGGWMDGLGYPFCRGRIFSHVETDAGQYNTPQGCFWASGAAMFIRAELYHSFGGFDGDYFAHNEEIDLCWRLKRAGYRVACFPQSVVYHLGGGTLHYDSPRKVFLNFRNSLFNLLKNEPAASLFWLIPARLLLDGIAALRFAVKGQFPLIAALLRSHFSFYGNFLYVLKKRTFGTQLVEKHRIGPDNTREGRMAGSIVWRHYIGRIMRFEDLNID